MCAPWKAIAVELVSDNGSHCSSREPWRNSVEIISHLNAACVQCRWAPLSLTVTTKATRVRPDLYRRETSHLVVAHEAALPHPFLLKNDMPVTLINAL